MKSSKKNITKDRYITTRLWALTCVTLLSFLISTCATAAEPIHNFTFGISSVNFRGLNKNDTAAALKAWTHAIIDEKKFHLILHIELFDSFDDLNRRYKSNDLNAASINVEEFMQLDEKPDNVYLPSYHQGPFIEYVLIVRKNDPPSHISDLLGKNISFHDSPRMIYSLPWLQLEFLEKTPGTKNIAQIEAINQFLIPSDNPSKSIFQVFFHQADAALVTLSTFELACELNPQLQKELKIYARSPELISSLFILRPSFQPPYRKQLEDFLDSMHTTPAGKQVLTTFQSEKITKFPVTILETTEKLLNNYHKAFTK